MAAFIDKIQKIPTKTRAIGFVVFIFVLIIVYVWLFQIPMNTKIDELDKALAAHRTTMGANDNKIKKLDELKVEVVSLEQRLVTLTEQLPPESEVSGLLRQIQTLVNQSGLSLKYWKPEGRRIHASGLYEELPIAITLTGGYHNTASFFNRVGTLTRIVNILNIKMGNMKLNKDGSVEITINCTAMTFSAVEKKVEAAKTKKAS